MSDEEYMPMPPKATFEVELEIESVTRGVPRFVLPDDDVLDAQRIEAITSADGYLRHDGHVYAVTMEDAL